MTCGGRIKSTCNPLNQSGTAVTEWALRFSSLAGSSCALPAVTLPGASEPVWPSGKALAGKQKDLGSIPLRLSFLFRKASEPVWPSGKALGW